MTPNSSSHWVFWVTRPRLEVRLRNSAVDNSGSWPARSLARTDQKNHTKTKAPTTSRMSISQTLSSAARMPMTIRTRPTADRTAPPVSKGRVGSAGRGSWIRRLSRMIAVMTSAWKTKAARQLMAEVMRPPSSGPAAAPMPPIALIAPNARARELTPVNNKVVRM